MPYARYPSQITVHRSGTRVGIYLINLSSPPDKTEFSLLFRSLFIFFLFSIFAVVYRDYIIEVEVKLDGCVAYQWMLARVLYLASPTHFAYGFARRRNPDFKILSV